MDLRVISVIEITALFAIILGGLGILLQVKGRKEINHQKFQRSWPTTKGTIAGSQVRKHLLMDLPAKPISSHLAYYSPEIIFYYRVAGKEYQSTSYKFSSASGFPKMSLSSFTQKSAQKTIHNHPCGKSVIVFYNPKDPEEAYLSLSKKIASSQIQKASGLVLVALALLIIVNSVFMVVYNKDDLAYANSLPALIPASTNSIIAGLENNLGLTCKPENPDVYGPAIGYKVNICGSDATSRYPIVWIFSRLNVPDRVDFIQVTPGINGKGADWVTLGKIAALTTSTHETQFLRDWVTLIAPRLLARGGETKVSIGKVSYQMFADANYPQTKIKLEIGTKQ